MHECQDTSSVPTSLTPPSSRFAAPCPAHDAAGQWSCFWLKAPGHQAAIAMTPRPFRTSCLVSMTHYEACFRRGSKHKGVDIRSLNQAKQGSPFATTHIHSLYAFPTRTLLSQRTLSQIRAQEG